MKKRILSAALALTMTLSLSGCLPQNEAPTTPSTTPPSTSGSAGTSQSTDPSKPLAMGDSRKSRHPHHGHQGPFPGEHSRRRLDGAAQPGAAQCRDWRSGGAAGHAVWHLFHQPGPDAQRWHHPRPDLVPGRRRGVRPNPEDSGRPDPLCGEFRLHEGRHGGLPDGAAGELPLPGLPLSRFCESARDAHRHSGQLGDQGHLPSRPLHRQLLQALPGAEGQGLHRRVDHPRRPGRDQQHL